MEELEKKLIITILEANNIIISGLRRDVDSDELTEFIDRQIANNNTAIDSLR
jgi:hypothetical protein